MTCIYIYRNTLLNVDVYLYSCKFSTDILLMDFRYAAAFGFLDIWFGNMMSNLYIITHPSSNQIEMMFICLLLWCISSLYTRQLQRRMLSNRQRCAENHSSVERRSVFTISLSLSIYIYKVVGCAILVF